MGEPIDLQGQGNFFCFGVCAQLLLSCLTFYDPVDCSPPGSSVHGVLQARILEQVAMLSSRGSSQPRDQTHMSCVSLIATNSLPTEPTQKLFLGNYCGKRLLLLLSNLVSCHALVYLPKADGTSSVISSYYYKIHVQSHSLNVVLGCNLKNDRMISVCFQGKPFNITVIQVYALTSNAEEAECFYEDLQDLLELTPPKDILFIIGD